MESKGKAKMMMDVLLSGMNKWWTWDEILMKIIPGFQRLSKNGRHIEVGKYMDQVSCCRRLCDSQGFTLIKASGKQGRKSEFKIANGKRDEKSTLEEMVRLHKPIIRLHEIEAERVAHLKEKKVLASDFSFNQYFKQVNSHPALKSEN